MGRKPKPPKPPKPIPSPPLSVDGDHIVAGDGKSLYTAEGTWTFGNGGQPGGWAILLNGTSAAGGSAVELWIENGGQVYALNSAAAWFLWQGGDWWTTTDPHPQPIPPEPEPIPPDPEPEPPDPPEPVPPGIVRISIGGVEQAIVYPWRVEVDREFATVFWGGDIRDPAPKHQGPYRVEFGTHALDVLRHDWGAMVSIGKPPAQRRTIAELKAAKLIPPYAVMPIADQTPLGQAAPYVPMGSSSLRPGNMGYAGDDYTIGLFNEWDAAYIANQADLASVEHIASAAHSLPVSLRENGATLDLLNQYPQLRPYGEQDKVWPESARISLLTGLTFQIDGGTLSHMPNVAYLRALLFGRRDDRLSVQDQANFLGSWAPYRDLNPTHIQTRGFAWVTRTIACAYLLAREFPQEPGFLPLSYWKQWAKLIADEFRRQWMDPALNSKAHLRSVHREAMVTWQEEYLASVLTWAVSAGVEEWREMATWIMEGVVARTSGKTAWPKTVISVHDGYAMIWARRKDTGTFVDVWTPENNAWPELIVAKDWAELWDWNRPRLTQGISGHYSSYVRMALILSGPDYANLTIDGLAEARANVIPNVIPQGRRHAVGG